MATYHRNGDSVSYTFIFGIPRPSCLSVPTTPAARWLCVRLGRAHLLRRKYTFADH